jgi:hypothetical protein
MAIALQWVWINHKAFLHPNKNDGKIANRFRAGRLDHIWLSSHPPLSIVTRNASWLSGRVFERMKEATLRRASFQYQLVQVGVHFNKVWEKFRVL